MQFLSKTIVTNISTNKKVKIVKSNNENEFNLTNLNILLERRRRHLYVRKCA